MFITDYELRSFEGSISTIFTSADQKPLASEDAYQQIMNLTNNDCHFH